MRVLVTGGSGFVGSHLVERLEADGHDVSVPRSSETDLTDTAATARLFTEARPELVFHLAAEVGGIGANRANPGRYWYANLMMGANVLEQARLHGTEKLVVAGTICAYPKYAPVPFREDDLWDGTRGDERTVRRRQEGGSRRCASLPGAVRDECDLPPAREPVRTARQLRPRDLACDPGPDSEDGRGPRARGALHHALGRRDTHA